MSTHHLDLAKRGAALERCLDALAEYAQAHGLDKRLALIAQVLQHEVDRCGLLMARRQARGRPPTPVRSASPPSSIRPSSFNVGVCFVCGESTVGVPLANARGFSLHGRCERAMAQIDYGVEEDGA